MEMRRVQGIPWFGRLDIKSIPRQSEEVGHEGAGQKIYRHQHRHLGIVWSAMEPHARPGPVVEGGAEPARSPSPTRNSSFYTPLSPPVAAKQASRRKEGLQSIAMVPKVRFELTRP